MVSTQPWLLLQVIISKEDGDEDDEITEILMKFRDRINDLPEEFRTLNLRYGVLRFGKTMGSNEPERINPQQHVLAVAPLNSMPYIDPPTPPGDVGSTPSKQETEAAEKVGPVMIFLPSHSTREEWNNIIFANRTGVAITGSAALGKVGPIIGLMNIGESEDSYLFQVSLLGVARDEEDFSCDIDPAGQIIIKGVTTDERMLHVPVDNQYFSGNFGNDGILEGIVKKSGL